MGYVSGREHALVDMRLYLPKEWTNDRKASRKGRASRKTSVIERDTSCAWKCWPSIETSCLISGLPVTTRWAARTGFRRRLDLLGECYLLAVPCNTTVRDLEVDAPAYSGRGRYPKRPWIRVDRLIATFREHGLDRNRTSVTVRKVP